MSRAPRYHYVNPRRKDDFTRKKVIWDNIVVAHLLGMTQTTTYDRPKVRDDATFESMPSVKKTTWITDVDEAAMWSDFLRQLDRHERSSRIRH